MVLLVLDVLTMGLGHVPRPRNFAIGNHDNGTMGSSQLKLPYIRLFVKENTCGAFFYGSALHAPTTIAS